MHPVPLPLNLSYPDPIQPHSDFIQTTPDSNPPRKRTNTPPAGDEKPTPKALKEHLGKYRKSLGGDNKITFGMSAKRSPDDGVPVGKPRKKAGGGTGAGTGAGVQKNKAAPRGKGAAAAKGKSANAKGKGKVATKGEVQQEEHGSDVDMDEEEQEEGIKTEFNEERHLFSGVSAEADS
jgi:hypothetical protein